jgi:hypothetical protein
MRKLASGLVLLAALFVVSAAQAQNVRFIRTNGNDANACTLAQPCRTLARGIQAAPVRGEVRLLDSGAFGAGVTVAKSLTISGNGNTLILTGPTTVSASAARVAFRDLLLTGLGTVSNGIVVNAAATVHIVRCEVERYTDDGVHVDTGGSEVFVSESIFRNNGDDGFRVDGGDSTRVTVDSSRFENNADRGATIDDAQSSVTRSVFSGNGVDGLGVGTGNISVARSIAADNDSGFVVLQGAEMHLESSVATGNSSSGLFIGTGSASISNVTITNNGNGIVGFSDEVRSRGNNRVFGNGVDFPLGAPTPLGGT